MSNEMDEIWDLFVDDGAQAMDAMETSLLALEGLDDPLEQASHIAALFRAVHTFKGNSRVLGLGVIESRAHLAEDLIGLVRDSGVALDAEILELLIETGDRLRDMLTSAATTRSDVEPDQTEDLCARLRSKIARCVGDPVPQDSAMDAGQNAPVADETTERDTDTEADALPTADLHDQNENAPAATSTPSPEGFSGSAARLADDPAYRRIFDDMVRDGLARLGNLVEADDEDEVQRRSARVLDDLIHAARQLGLDTWLTALSGCKTETCQPTEIIAAINAMMSEDGLRPPQDQGAEDTRSFFARIQAPLSIIARIGISRAAADSAVDQESDQTRLMQAVQEIREVADTEGYVRVSHVVAAFADISDTVEYRRQELSLYEELAAIEAVIGEVSADSDASPAALLAGWCADHVFDTLDELEVTLDNMRQADAQGEQSGEHYRDLERLVRLIHHACRAYGLNMASQLAMSLLDLFGRGHANGDAPDAILIRIARGFIDTLELVFDALREGEPPNTERLEQLFQEASEAGFNGAGVMTATAIERKLGLPPEFHRVLSPDSTRSAAASIAAKHSFYILRADVNDDTNMAEALFGFIGSGKIQAITNVTVFDNKRTLFDFLIATPLDDLALTEALARMDPAGTKLVLLRRLELTEADEPLPTDSDKQTVETEAEPALAADVSAKMLEQIGEIAAGQAMVHGMLDDLVENDLVAAVDNVFRLHGHHPQHARQALHALADGVMDQLRKLAQLETQILGHMAELQYSTAEMRARPVETVLRPLVAMASTQARQLSRDVRMTTSGAGFTLDIALLDNLKQVLRPLVMACIAADEPVARQLHLVVQRSEDQVSVTLDVDGASPPDSAALASIRADLSRAGGQLRCVKPPKGGYRFHIDLPMNLVVIDGMVVGAGGTRYVLPIDSIRTILQPAPDAFIDVAAAGAHKMLRLSSDEVIKIQPLSALQHQSFVQQSPELSAVSMMQLDSDQPDQTELPVPLVPQASKISNSVIVVLGREGNSVAVPVDDLVGQQLVLLRPLRGVMSGLKNVSGVALLSGGDVGMVLSPRALCEKADMRDMSTISI